MERLHIRLMRKNLSDAINRTFYQGERIVVTRHGRGMAALVPMEDLEALEALENHIDLKEAKAALADMKAKGIKPIPWAQAERLLDEGKAQRGRTGRKAG